MKRLQEKGLGSKLKQAEPITEKEEEILWEKGELGDHTPQSLLNTMVYMNSVYFALRSGKEHRNLRFSPSQNNIVENDEDRAYVEYVEDMSKNHPGGLKGRRMKRKAVKHHANIIKPQQCFVRLLRKYKEMCPTDPKNNAFYLQPLKKPTAYRWFSREPLGHNKLSQTVQNMCSSAGIHGFRTNHSLRATSATRLFNAGADEQLIMERTGHRSVDGVRSYKRTSDQLTEDVSDILNNSSGKRHKTTAQPLLLSQTSDSTALSLPAIPSPSPVPAHIPSTPSLPQQSGPAAQNAWPFSAHGLNGCKGGPCRPAREAHYLVMGKTSASRDLLVGHVTYWWGTCLALRDTPTACKGEHGCEPL